MKPCASSGFFKENKAPLGIIYIGIKADSEKKDFFYINFPLNPFLITDDT